MRLLVATVSILTVSAAFAQDGDKLKSHAEKLRSELAEVEAKIAKAKGFTKEQLATTDTIALKVGSHGLMRRTNDKWLFRVDDVIDDSNVLLSSRSIGLRFVCRGLSTKNLAEGQLVYLPGCWHVAESKKFGGSTFLVAEPLLGCRFDHGD